jgi:hypothetical protein
VFFTDHAIQQGAVAGILLRLAGASPVVVGSGIALAGLLNTVPDVWPLVKALVGRDHPRVTEIKAFCISLPYRWDVYHDLHFVDMGWYSWAWRLHIEVDKPFHIPDGNWWPREWRRCVGYWLLEAFLLFLCFG